MKTADISAISRPRQARKVTPCGAKARSSLRRDRTGTADFYSSHQRKFGWKTSELET